MAKKLFAFGNRPIKITGFGNEKKVKRTLGTREREILWIRAGKKCESCKEKIDSGDMQAGHKNKASSKGGKATLSNSVCLCYGCNKRQGTDSWATYMRKSGKKVTRTATSGKKIKPSKKKAKKAKQPTFSDYVSPFQKKTKQKSFW